MKKLLIVLVAALALTSCTDNSRARQWGATEKITLDKGERLINITWKDKTGSDLWILTKKDSTTKPSTYSFKEKSSLGIMNGEIIINEQ